MDLINPSFHNNDISGTLHCEHCDATKPIYNGYNDGHWWGKVLPAIHCHFCGKNRAGELTSEEVKARNVANGVYGI